MSDQRICSVRLYRVSSPVEPPRGVSIRLATAHAYVLVKLVDEAGRVGWGETYDQFGMFEVVRDLAGLLIGHEPWPMRHHRDRMAITRTNSEARSALMIALDDLPEEIGFEGVHHEGYAREGKDASQGACAREGRAGECAGTAGARVVMSVSKVAPSPSTVPTQTQKV